MLWGTRVAEVDVVEFYSIFDLDVLDALTQVLWRLDFRLAIYQVDDLPSLSQCPNHGREQTLNLQNSEHCEHEGLVAGHNVSD